MDEDGALSVAQLARRCAGEMARYMRQQSHDSRYCYELFRCALVGQDDEAWTALYGQYRHLVRRWLGNTAGDADALVNQTFERFWQAFSPDRFADFATLDKILAYLRRCAQCVAIDAKRHQARRQIEQATLAQMQEVVSEKRSLPPEWVLGSTLAEQLYGRALERLNSPQERLLFQASFEWDLRPGVIAERWPNVFASVQEVYRVKERILRRLRRDDGLRRLLDMEDGDDSGGE